MSKLKVIGVHPFSKKKPMPIWFNVTVVVFGWVPFALYCWTCVYGVTLLGYTFCYKRQKTGAPWRWELGRKCCSYKDTFFQVEARSFDFWWLEITAKVYEIGLCVAGLGVYVGEKLAMNLRLSRHRGRGRIDCETGDFVKP